MPKKCKCDEHPDQKVQMWWAPSLCFILIFIKEGVFFKLKKISLSFYSPAVSREGRATCWTTSSKKKHCRAISIATKVASESWNDRSLTLKGKKHWYLSARKHSKTTLLSRPYCFLLERPTRMGAGITLSSVFKKTYNGFMYLFRYLYAAFLPSIDPKWLLV